ncbi:MAG: VWA domain-containing protein, partial [Tepidisphaeraceae bacterium]
GLGGAAVPLVLHLLSRARYRSVDWGAMMFLHGVDVRQRQATKLKQLILLAMRMAIVACLAMALARPIVRGAVWGGLAAEGRTTAVIIVDRSASMGYDENGKTRLDQAKDAVMQVLANLHKGDQVSLVLVGDEQADSAPMPPTSDLQAVASRVNELKVSHDRANVVDGLLAAAEIFDRHEKSNRELYVVCDRQAASWREVNAGFKTVWDERLGTSAVPLRFFVVPVGGGEADNVTIQAVELVNPPAVINSSAEIEVQVRNFGAVPRAGLPLKLSAGGKEILNTTVNLAPDSTASVRASVKLPESGSQVVTASVETTGLTLDDRADQVIDVIDPVKVLIVSGDERAGVFRSESDFIKLALAPFATIKRPGPDPAAVKVVTVDKWLDEDLTKYQVVVLANVSQVSATQSRALEQWVYGGGGLFVAPGNLSRVENYNTLLYRDGTGILPAMLYPASPGDGSQVTGILGIDLANPIFKFLKGRPDPIPSATVGRYFPSWTGRADVHVLASYVSGH